jgi:hypothetical protein
MRLACLYALLDCSAVVNAYHLMAALDVWRYCEDSARFIFGDAVGDAMADEILRELRQNPQDWRGTIFGNTSAATSHRRKSAGRLDYLWSTAWREWSGARKMNRRKSQQSDGLQSAVNAINAV